MKRFIGLFLVAAGGVAILWGAYHIMLGQITARFGLTETLSVSALTGGLLGVGAFTVGLIWLRD